MNLYNIFRKTLLLSGISNLYLNHTVNLNLDNEFADTHFSLEALSVDKNLDISNANTKKNVTKGYPSQENENLAYNVDESLQKMKDEIKKDLEKKDPEQTKKAVNEDNVKPKVSIEHILKKYSNIKDK